MTSTRALPLLLLLSVGGCAHYGTPGDPPQWCASGADQGREVTIQVYVELKAREPIVVTPTDCRVRPGSLVRWEATGPDRAQFQRVDFKNDSAAASGKRSIPAQAGGATRRAEMIARWVGKEARFPDSVFAGDKELDPDIIIDPARYRQ